MTFNINNYKGDYVMHCKTKEEAKSFCDYLHKHGRTWCGGRSYKDYTMWDQYMKDTAYCFNEGSFSPCAYYATRGYTVLEWSDFTDKPFTKADLKTGDVILRKSGEVEIVIRELNVLVYKNGWSDLASVDEDLTDKTGKSYNIVAVRRPIEEGDCQFCAFERNYGTLIYDRNRDEVEELTLAEVCKLLGKNIKIIP